MIPAPPSAPAPCAPAPLRPPPRAPTRAPAPADTGLASRQLVPAPEVSYTVWPMVAVRSVSSSMLFVTKSTRIVCSVLQFVVVNLTRWPPVSATVSSLESACTHSSSTGSCDSFTV